MNTIFRLMIGKRLDVEDPNKTPDMLELDVIYSVLFQMLGSGAPEDIFPLLSVRPQTISAAATIEVERRVYLRLCLLHNVALIGLLPALLPCSYFLHRACGASGSWWPGGTPS